MLTPDSHRLGGAKWQVIDGILTSIDLALATHVENLGTLERAVAGDPHRRPKSSSIPLPFCPPDEAYAKVLDWVKKRRRALSLRRHFLRRTPTALPHRRLEELCGVRFVAERYPNIAVDSTNAVDQPCLRVTLRARR